MKENMKSEPEPEPCPIARFCKTATWGRIRLAPWIRIRIEILGCMRIRKKKLMWIRDPGYKRFMNNFHAKDVTGHVTGLALTAVNKVTYLLVSFMLNGR
jgi:hypothetical protein